MRVDDTRDSRGLADCLLVDLDRVGNVRGDLSDIQALTVALSTVTIAINELRESVERTSDITNATLEAVVGELGDIAEILVEDDDDDPDPGEEIYVDETQVTPFGFDASYFPAFLRAVS